MIKHLFWRWWRKAPADRSSADLQPWQPGPALPADKRGTRWRDARDAPAEEPPALVPQPADDGLAQPADADPALVQQPVADMPADIGSLAPEPATPGLSPAAAARHAAAGAHWPVLALGALSAAALVWLAATAWWTAAASAELGQVTMALPRLAGYPGLDKLDLEPGRSGAAASTFGQAVEVDALREAMRPLASFENARAESALRAARPVVSRVAPESAAARSGIAAGDLIAAVDGRDVSSVWDVYRDITAEARPTLPLTVLRDGQRLDLALATADQAPLDMANHGLRFGVPDHLRYIGDVDVLRLHRQVVAVLLDGVPDDRHPEFARGLLQLTTDLANNAPQLRAIAPGRPGFVSGEALLIWYRAEFLKQMGLERAEVDRLLRAQADALGNLGRALLAVCVLALLWMVSNRRAARPRRPA